MFIKKSLLFLLLIFLLMVSFIPFIPSVYADFVLISDQATGSTCKGSTLLFPVTVTGTGSYTLNLEGGGSSWSVVVPSGFSSSGSKLAYVYATPHSRVLAGNYDLKVVVNDGVNIKRLPLVITVEDCATFEVEPVARDQEQFVCACESGRYRFAIKNTGAYRESYRLDVKSEIASWLTLSQSTLDLNPGEKKEVFVAVNPACGNFGQRAFTLNVVSSSGRSLSLDTSVQIESCFDYQLETDKDFVDMCEHSYERVKVQLKNTAVRANTYDLQLLGPGWANLEKNRAFLGVGSTGELVLLLAPDYGVEGEYALTLKARGEKGKIEQVKDLQVRVRRCHGFTLDVVDSNARVCQGVSKSYLMKVVNTGEVEKEVKLERDLPWVMLSQETLLLKPGESKEVLLEVESGNVSAGRYKVEVRAVALDDSGLEAEDSIQLEVVGRKECYNVEVSVANIQVVREGSATLPITVRNYGIEAGVYEIGVSGNAVSFIQINPAVIEVMPGASEIVYAYLAPSRVVSLGEYQLQVHVKNKQSGILVSRDFTVEVIEGVEGSITGGVAGEIEQGTGKLPWYARLSDWFDKIAARAVRQENATNLTLLETTSSSTSSSTSTSTSGTTSTITSTTLISGFAGFAEVDIRYKPVVSEDVQFGFNNQTHTLQISEVEENQITLMIQSEPQVLVLRLNESKQVDLDGDGKMDMKVELQGIENGTPSLQLSVVDGSEAGVGQAGRGSYRNYVIVGIVIIVLLILIGVFAFKRDEGEQPENGKKKEEEDEEEEEKVVEKKHAKKPEHIEVIEEEKIPVGRYVLLALILAIAVWLGFRYNAWADIGVYRYYVILGVVLLVLLILVIRYWNRIVEFFEEEIDEGLQGNDEDEKGEEVEKAHPASEKRAAEKKKVVRKARRK